MNAALPLGWVYLPVAFALGALHALALGHGKSQASIYLVSGKHNRKDVFLLGFATTLTHTAVVLLLSALGLALKRFVSTAALERGVALGGGAALVVMGAWLASHGVRDLRRGHTLAYDDRGAKPRGRGFWGIAMLGFSNGALPGPGALASMLIAVSVGRPGLGFATVLVYSFGLASALMVIGILVVEAGRQLHSLLPSDRAMLWLPIAGALLTLAAGLWLWISASA